MNNLKLLFTKKKLITLSYILLPFIIATLLIFYIYNFEDSKDFPMLTILIYGSIHEVIHPFIIISYLSLYMMNKNTFFIFYFLFFIFYFLFFIYTINFTLVGMGTRFMYNFALFSKQFMMFALDLFSIIFFIIFLIYIFIMKRKILRYVFAFLTAISHIILNIYILNIDNFFDNIIFMIFNVNEQFYLQNLYLIPLSFALIQLSIEAYYFYKKEKPKWIRYNRMKEYKENKNK